MRVRRRAVRTGVATVASALGKAPRLGGLHALAVGPAAARLLQRSPSAGSGAIRHEGRYPVGTARRRSPSSARHPDAPLQLAPRALPARVARARAVHARPVLALDVTDPALAPVASPAGVTHARGHAAALRDAAQPMAVAPVRATAGRLGAAALRRSVGVGDGVALADAAQAAAAALARRPRPSTPPILHYRARAVLAVGAAPPGLAHAAAADRVAGAVAVAPACALHGGLARRAAKARVACADARRDRAAHATAVAVRGARAPPAIRARPPIGADAHPRRQVAGAVGATALRQPRGVAADAAQG